jgi:RNA polymerase sigma-70 factor (ECF subfamily)
MDDALAKLYREESRRVFSTLVRLLGSFDLAEDALHDAFLAASEQWPLQGVPARPVPWLVSAGRFRAIDRLRRERRFVALDEAADRVDAAADPAPGWEERWDSRGEIEDDRLRLVFTCCHPSLSEEARIALTLREVCGLTTEAIAGAFLIATPALPSASFAPRQRSRRHASPTRCPGPRSGRRGWPACCASSTSSSPKGTPATPPVSPTKPSAWPGCCTRCCPSPRGPASSRCFCCTTRAGRARRHRRRRARAAGGAGSLAAGTAPPSTRAGARPRRPVAAGARRLALQAAIAALHGEAPSAAATDWPQIVGLYDALLRVEPSPVIALNRAVAVAMREAARKAGLALIEPLLPALPGYHAAPAAAADLCRRAGRSRKPRRTTGRQSP